MTAPAITIKSVTKRFKKKEAVQNISMDIPKGEIVSILGPNGAGKSTTINMMLGILKPTFGEVLLNGKNPTKYENRYCLGVMRQTIGLPELLQPHELIQLWSSYYPYPLAKQEVIELAGLKEIISIPFNELSGGQKRRVAFALAICGNPDILFLDEPSAGLDIDSRNLLWREIKNFASQNKTVVLCTHYLEEADILSNRIVLMNKGRIITDGTPKKIKSQMGSKILKCKTDIPLPILTAHRLIAKVNTQFELFVMETSHPETLLKELLEMDPNLSDLEVNNINLEEAFLKLTNN